LNKIDPADPVLVCPLTGQPLRRQGDGFVTADGSHAYGNEDGIALLFAHADGRIDTATDGVQAFYTESPFPNYNDFDSVASFVRQADSGVFARLLREQVPTNATVLEVGCGTGQLSNYLAATCLARVFAADMTLASLRLGRDFARRNGIQRVRFLQMNLFRPCIRPGSMDIVISNGVLHHTADTRAAFLGIAPLVKPGGHIVIGLYNHIGRLRTDFRRALWKLVGDRALVLDPHLRRRLSPEKRRAWIRDQYAHPVERKHSMSETLGWFEEAGFDFVSSIPPVSGSFGPETRLFERRPPGTPLDRLMAETGMLFSTYGGEGGLYVMIGRRRDGSG
jgi:2-polyprenyl-3-methyl-5-hydroxy-6-metoxy-1,4-benzoquinol methylase